MDKLVVHGKCPFCGDAMEPVAHPEHRRRQSDYKGDLITHHNVDCPLADLQFKPQQWNRRALTADSGLLRAAGLPGEPEAVCWFQHGPYDAGERIRCVFVDPNDDNNFSALVYKSDYDTLRATAEALQVRAEQAEDRADRISARHVSIVKNHDEMYAELLLDANSHLRRAAAAESERDALKAELDRAMTLIELNGVPKERARNVCNGIDVIVTRMQRGIDYAESELQALKDALGEPVAWRGIENRHGTNMMIYYESKCYERLEPLYALDKDAGKGVGNGRDRP